jgi:hypothetical protein
MMKMVRAVYSKSSSTNDPSIANASSTDDSSIANFSTDSNDPNFDYPLRMPHDGLAQLAAAAVANEDVVMQDEDGAANEVFEPQPQLDFA